MPKDYERASGGSSGKGVYCLPDLNAEDKEFLAYRERLFNRKSAIRNKRLQQAALSYAYVLGRQWAEIDTDVMIDGVRGYVIRDMINHNPLIDVPRPVTNRIEIAVEIELSSLGKRELIPNIHSSSRDPRITMAAKHAKNILEYKLRKKSWPEVRELANFIHIVTGTVGLRAAWDEKETDTAVFGSDAARECRVCGTKLADEKIPRSALGMHQFSNMETIREIAAADEDEPYVQITHCPVCTEPVELQPYDVDNEQDARTYDMFERPLGIELPRGDVDIEVVSPFEMYPENGGVNVYPHNFRMLGVKTIRNLEWIFERWPQLEGKLQPEDSYELMRDHPILGEWQFAGNYSSEYDSGIFDYHARMYEIIHEPGGKRYPEGARIVMVGDQVAEVQPLYRKTKLQLDPRGIAPPVEAESPIVSVAVARFKMRMSEFFGRGLPDSLISPQNRINGMDAQGIDLVDRWGSPNVWVPDGMEITGPEWLPTYGSGKFIRYRIDPTRPEQFPREFGGNANLEPMLRLRETATADLKELGGPAALEMGEAPKNISTTSGLQLLGEAAERRRGPHERALVEAYQKTWRTILQMLAVFRVEDEEYQEEIKEDVYEKKMFNRMQIHLQTNVIIEKQGYVDKSLYLREATREAMADMLYDTSSQAAKKKILEYRGLPTDVNEGENRQVALADEQFINFTDRGIVPIVDDALDNAKIRFQVLGTHLLSSQGRALDEQFRWPEVLERISGYETELYKQEEDEKAVIEFYGGRRDPKDPAVAEYYAQQVVTWTKQMAAWQKLQEAPPLEAIVPGAAPPPPTEPPMKPPPPVFLPALRQRRIEAIWQNKLKWNPIQMQPEIIPGFQAYLQFRAAVDTYRLNDRDQLLAMAPPAQPPGQGTTTNPVVPGVDRPMIPNPPNPANPPNPPNPGSR